MGFLAALHFLTTMPLTPRRLFTPSQLGESLAYYPLVGAALGIALVLSHTLLSRVFSASIAAALTLVIWVLLSGGLHLDGLMDACDGLLAHRPAEERLRIMRDVHVGAWGVLGAGLLLLVKFGLLLDAALDPRALILSPLLARWALSLSVVCFPYGRAEGWGGTLKMHAGRRQLALATAGALCLALVVQPSLGLSALVVVAVTTLLIARFTLDRLPGLTGDVYGLIAEVCEAIVLLVFAARPL